MIIPIGTFYVFILLEDELLIYGSSLIFYEIFDPPVAIVAVVNGITYKCFGKKEVTN